MSDTTLALSIMQPWAWLIVNGHKDVENRSWPTRFRGRVLIHAGKRFDPDYLDEGATVLWDWPDIQRPDGFDTGGIVGVAEIVGCVTESTSPWFFGPHGFLIRNARPLPFRLCRGQLGFFTPDYSPPTPKPKPSPRQASMFGDAP